MTTQKKAVKQSIPAYPLFVKDPFFSIWSPGELLNENDTTFWTGKTVRTYGLVYADGKAYSFMGVLPKTEKLTQTKLTVTAFGTEYSFTCDKFDLTVNFVSPLMPDDLTVLACPVCYMTYNLTPKTTLDEVTVALYLDEEYCYDRMAFPVRMGRIKSQEYQTAWFGLKKQLVMSQSFDDSSAEWGYWYVSGKKAAIASKNMLDRFIACGATNFDFDENGRKYIMAYDSENKLN